MRRDPAIQFTLTPPKPPVKPPGWLKDFFDTIGRAFEQVGRFIKWIASFFPDAPYARIILWSVLALGAAALLWAAYNRIRYGSWRLRLPKLASKADPIEEEWVPEERGARSWLQEADALALDGRFAEAIHHLLSRSVEDIAKRRPALARPALTSRELASADTIPHRARSLFEAIASLVERSLFAGLAVGEVDWLKAREAYSDFALSSAWRS